MKKTGVEMNDGEKDYMERTQEAGEKGITFSSRQDLLDDLEKAHFRLAFFDMENASNEQFEKTCSKDKVITDMAESFNSSAIRLIADGIGKSARKAAFRKVKPYFSKALCIAASFIILLNVGFSVAVASSSSVRTKVMQMIFDSYDVYTQISLKENASEDMRLFIPNDWNGEYFPSYLPADYHFVKANNSDMTSVAEYKDNENNHLRFQESSLETSTNIDTEKFKVTSSTVHDLPAMVVEKDETVTVIWNEFDKYFCVYYNGDVETALKIARSFVRIR